MPYPINPQERFKQALATMARMKLSEQKEADTQEYREQNLSLREARFQLAQEQAQVKEQGDLLKTQLQRQQIQQTGAAQELIAELDPESLYFPKALNTIRSMYPEAFRNPDSVPAVAATQMQQTHEKLLAYHIDQAKELGLPLDDSNPGFDKNTGRIDWDKARKNRESWNQQNAEKLNLKPSKMDASGAVPFSNQSELQDARQDDAAKRAKAAAEEKDKWRQAYSKRRDLEDYARAKKDSIAAQANVAMLTQQLAADPKAVDKDKVPIADKLAVAQTALKEHKQIIDMLAPQEQPAQPQDNFEVGKQYKDAQGNIGTYKGNGQWE